MTDRAPADLAETGPPTRDASRADPPRLAVALAEWCIDVRVREAVVGDLVESYGTVNDDAASAARTRRWFWCQVLIAIARFPPRPHVTPAQGDGLVSGFINDLVRAARTLMRAPAFIALCAITLGIGIGAATAIFSVADPVILRPLPYASPERLFVVWENDDQGRRSNTSFATYADVAASARSFETTAAVGDWQPTLVRNGSAERLTGLRVSWGYFRTIGVHLALGLDFVRDDDAPSRNGVVILSHALWRSHFNGDSAVVGSFTDVGGRQMRIGGVLPADYDDVLQPGAQVWRVLGYDAALPYACRTCRHLRMIARAKAGVASGAAHAELNVISSRLVRENPRDYPGPGLQLVPAQEEVTRSIRPALTALLAAVGLLLLIATVNVSGLQLARALRREKEFAVRAALGAGAGRLTRQLVAEGVVLAVASGLTGLLLAQVGLVQLVARLPQTLPRLSAVHLDFRAFALAALVTLSSGVAIGLVPAWHARRRTLIESLRGARRVAGASHRLRATLVVSEVAVAVMLLAGAGQLARSLSRLLAINAGVSLTNVATAQVQVSGTRYAETAAVLAWQDQLVDAARAVPGVQSAALASQLPLGGSFDSYGIQAEDKPLANPELAPSADRYTVTTDYLKTMTIPLVAGRDFEAGDNGASAAPVAIVSRALARRIWGAESAIGKRVHSGEPSRPWYTVVGVAGDVHGRGLDDAETMQIYVPTRRWFFSDNGVDVVVRTSGDPRAVLAGLRRAMLAPDPQAVVARLATMDDVLAASTAQRTLALTLFAVFAAIALFLAAAGIFGALAGAVAERRREIGLRSALGATSADIVGGVLREGFILAGLGAAIGLAGSLAGSQVIETLLFAGGSRDLATILGVSVVVALAAVAASVVPAWRAIRVDPIMALRSD